MSFETGRRFYMLSFDHRGSIEKELLHLTTEPDAAERSRISTLKGIIYAGFRQAVAKGAPKDACGILIDEEFGAGIARSAKAAGYTLAMPVEQSGPQEKRTLSATKGEGDARAASPRRAGAVDQGARAPGDRLMQAAASEAEP